MQWVGEAEWIYRCEFELDRLPEDGEAADLVFEGLDTFATVFRAFPYLSRGWRASEEMGDRSLTAHSDAVNGKKVLESSNMFLSHRVSALPSLRRGLNTLYLTFHSSFLRGRELEERALGRAQHWPCWNGDPSRLFVRKAGYGYGWDWGPCVVTAGPYRPVRLEVYRSRIIDLCVRVCAAHAPARLPLPSRRRLSARLLTRPRPRSWPRAHVSDSLEASLSLSWTVSDDTLPGLAAAARLVSPRGVALRKTSFEGAACAGEHVWRLDGEGEVELWWAAGMGEQPLYEVAVDLVDMVRARLPPSLCLLLPQSS